GMRRHATPSLNRGTCGELGNDGTLVRLVAARESPGHGHSRRHSQELPAPATSLADCGGRGTGAPAAGARMTAAADAEAAPAARSEAAAAGAACFPRRLCRHNLRQPPEPSGATCHAAGT